MVERTTIEGSSMRTEVFRVRLTEEEKTALKWGAQAHHGGSVADLVRELATRLGEEMQRRSSGAIVHREEEPVAKKASEAVSEKEHERRRRARVKKMRAAWQAIEKSGKGLATAEELQRERDRDRRRGDDW